MGASITLAGENLIAQKHATLQPLKVARFIFANVPGLNPSTAVDRAAAKPPAAQIVYTYQIPNGNAGYVNPNQVVYSSQLGSDLGDWDFNWVGLESDEGVLFAVSYVPLQQKRRNIPPLQIGNNVTRNFLVVFDGAHALTGITIDASTWQHDFTVRLAGIDERERLSNRDVFGRACFFGTGLQLEKVAGAFQLKAGTAYIEGIRLQQSAALPVAPSKFPATAWLDVSLERALNDVAATMKVVFAADRPDYSDSVGVKHYCVALADLPDANTITDRRTVEAINGPLVTHFAARIGDYPNLRARATTKDDVDLGNLPNAKTDAADLEDSETLASAKSVWTVYKQLNIGAKAGKYFGVKINNRGQVTEGYTLNPLAEALLGASSTDEAKSVLGLSELPLFMPLWFPSRPMLDATAGFFAADGQEIARALVPSAAARLTSNVPLVPLVTEGIWQTDIYSRGAYTLGDGATTIRLPDYNGKSPGSIGAAVVRGDGAKSAGTAGVIQPSAFESHSHGVPGRVLNRLAHDESTEADVGVNRTLSDGQTELSGADETRATNVTGVWGIKLFGAIADQGTADVSALLAAYAALAADLENSFGFSIIYPNGGSLSAPANVTFNSRYILDNPFAGHEVTCLAEIKVGEKWGDSGWFYSAAGFGTKASQLDLNTLVVQTGSSRVGYSSSGSGDPFGHVNTALTTAPCRVKVWRVKG